MAKGRSFVPADRAIIGRTDKILARIATRETVSKIQSAFMIDLHQITSILRLATRRSLVVIDEFGKGTDSSDGAGLACGAFENLLRRGPECPKVLAATHFHEIFESGFMKPSRALAFGHMEVKVNESTQDVSDQVTYLYNLKAGRSSSSLGTICAALNGINSAIIKRAEDLITMSARGEDLVAACALGDEDLADLEEAETVARLFLAEDFLVGVDADSDLNTNRARERLSNVLESVESMD